MTPTRWPPSSTRWLATKSADGTGPEVFDVQAPGSNGFSNETILCRTRSRRRRRRSDWSSGWRRPSTCSSSTPSSPPSTGPCAPWPTAARRSRSPASGWYEEDPQYFGVPFFSMDHVEGLVPSDNIPYTMEGWVIEATPEQQERMWWSGIDALAAVHRTDWRAAGLEWLGMTAPGASPGIEQQLSYYRDFLDWATKGEKVPVIESTWQWLVDHQPAEEGDVVISWGDSRIGNIIWDDFQAAAVSTGRWPRWPSPRWTWAGGSTSTASSPRASACPGRPASGPTRRPIARYSELMGRPMRDIFFYEIFSGFRFAVVMYRLSDLVFADEDMEGDADMATDNIATQLLAKMLDLEPPT